jgi:hypothetical protein
MVPRLAAQAASDTVRMIVTAEARKGNQPPTLAREDVLVYEGRDRVPVRTWTPFQGANARLELYILIDDSLSPDFGTHIADLQDFISQQPASTMVGVAYMRNGTVSITQKPTADHTAAAKSIRLPEAVAGSSPYESLQSLLKQWPEGAPRREVLMISHGIEPFGPAQTSNPIVETTVAAAQRAGIPVFTIYSAAAGHWGHTWWRSTWGQTYLSEIADESGAEEYGQLGVTPVTLKPFLQDLTQRLQHQYELAFSPKPQATAGLQPVRVTTEVPGVDLVAPTRVYIPANQ